MERKALVLGFALAAWVAIGLWLEVYEKLDIGHPRVILRDSARQCVYGALLPGRLRICAAGST